MSSVNFVTQSVSTVATGSQASGSSGYGSSSSARNRPSPKNLTKEFLRVDLVNNLDQLADDREQVLAHVKERGRARQLQRPQLLQLKPIILFPEPLFEATDNPLSKS